MEEMVAKADEQHLDADVEVGVEDVVGDRSARTNEQLRAEHTLE